MKWYFISSGMLNLTISLHSLLSLDRFDKWNGGDESFHFKTGSQWMENENVLYPRF